MTHTITILGSTGSIGRQTLSVAEELSLRVAALTAEKNVDLLEAQCRKYRPELAVMTENAACLLYTSPSPRDRQKSRMPSSA